MKTLLTVGVNRPFKFRTGKATWIVRQYNTYIGGESSVLVEQKFGYGIFGKTKLIKHNLNREVFTVDM